MGEIILAAEIQTLIEKYGEEAVKEALMKALEKEMNPACPEE
jgi:hypothetical protein